MSYLVTWDFYSTLFPSSEVTVQEFNNFLPQAQAKLEVWTHQRILTETTLYKVAQIKQTLCYLVNAIAIQKEIPLGITSISNDGYSESYLKRTEAENELKGIAYAGLSGTGLMGAL
jgi:hypothetical protein